MVEQGNRRDGRFFGRRVNCEQVPLFPAGAVARILDDPRKIPYLLVWKSRSDDTVQEAVRVAPHKEIEGLGGLDWTNVAEIERHDGTRTFIRTVLRPLPRNGGRVRLLICLHCQIPRRALYGWRPGGRYTRSAERSWHWNCRECSGLRYASEGGYLRPGHLGRLGQLGVMFRALGNLPRPESWLPYVFTSVDDPHLDEIVR